MTAETPALRGGIDRMTPVFSPGEKVVLLDIPNHFNVGDDLILAGEIEYFRSRRVDLVGMHSWATYTPKTLSRLPENVTIAFHGGGNFGDIYSTFQAFREEVVSAHPERRIVVLPQSMEFRDRQRLREASAIFRAHPNVTVLCRDRPSHELALEHLSQASLLVPDMAHFLQPGITRQSHPAAGGTLLFRRRDREAAQQAQSGSFDWGDILHFPVKSTYRSVRLLQRLEKNRLLPDGVSARALTGLQGFVIKRAIAKFNRYAAIDTDRMHAAILGLMMGRQVVLRDNCYGKLRRYADAWLDGNPNLILTAQN